VLRCNICKFYGFKRVRWSLIIYLYVVYLRPQSVSQGYTESTEWAILKAINWEGRGKKLSWPKQLTTAVFLQEVQNTTTAHSIMCPHRDIKTVLEIYLCCTVSSCHVPPREPSLL